MSITTENESGQARVAVVTGGSRGIGNQVARKLAADGLAVVVVYGGNQAAADVTVKEIREAGGQAIAAQADVADENDMAEVFDLAEQTFGGVDVVVNAAGRMVLSTLAELDLNVLDEMHRTNIRGTFVVSQQAVRRLRPGGTLINFSSSVVGLAFPRYSGYAASKGAVEAMTLILAREMRGRDITVNVVAPGPTATDLLYENNTEENLGRLAAAPPLERLGTAEDITAVVTFLASPEGHWVNGQVIRANGGAI
ncbi:SDR family oxidoreductase [Planotetraspora kaengkrachanensis]|uniref:3-ketoacyl-ACP reductase n=1 Tax=Planotetraspora kaengkrachanensis TaxID=575193 RepID=A0A8J3PZG8_9ACTN|nr:SDR family oxidoreductase [Planotetraspora kaengkrachanensis]GIG83971.1 3-ketoacyl-ACP reductase [Planotetraspora kaengkrachanensis]